jgi:hypothetical protein
MAHRRSRRSNPERVTFAHPVKGGRVSFSRGEVKPYARAKAKRNLLAEPASAIRQHPLAFTLGAFVAGVVGTLVVSAMMAQPRTATA